MNTTTSKYVTVAVASAWLAISGQMQVKKLRIPNETAVPVKVYGQVSEMPVQRQKPSADVVAKYLHNGVYSGYKSDARKQELLSNISKVRSEIRAMALTVIHKGNTTIRPVPRIAMEAVSSWAAIDMLVDRIWENKTNV